MGDNIPQFFLLLNKIIIVIKVYYFCILQVASRIVCFILLRSFILHRSFILPKILFSCLAKLFFKNKIFFFFLFFFYFPKYFCFLTYFFFDPKTSKIYSVNFLHEKFFWLVTLSSRCSSSCFKKYFYFLGFLNKMLQRSFNLGGARGLWGIAS